METSPAMSRNQVPDPLSEEVVNIETKRPRRRPFVAKVGRAIEWVWPVGRERELVGLDIGPAHHRIAWLHELQFEAQRPLPSQLRASVAEGDPLTVKLHGQHRPPRRQGESSARGRHRADMCRRWSRRHCRAGAT